MYCHLSLLFRSPQFIPLYLKRHWDVVGEEKSRSQALRHGDMGTVDVGGELRDGVQSDVAFERTGYPRAYAALTGEPYPLFRTVHTAVQGGLQDDV